MDQRNIGVLLATVVGTGAAAEVQDGVWSQLAVIAVGAFGGALFGIMNAPRTAVSQALREMTARFLPSACLSGPLVYVAQAYLTAGHYDIPKVMVLLAVSFFAAAPAELVAKFRPVWAVVSRLRAKE